MKKLVLLIAVSAVVCTAIICALLFSKWPSSDETVSVKEWIASRNGDLGVEQIIALTEVSDEYDLVFYYTADHQVAANFLVKDEGGKYTALVMTTTYSLDRTNQITGSTRQSHFADQTLYWGIAQSPQWTINYPDSHQIVVDELVLGYYIHHKSLDEEILELEFVYNR